MHNFESEVYKVWRPQLDEVIRQAIRQRSAVQIKTYLPLDECNFADATLTGRFYAIDDYQAQFLTDSFDLASTSLFPPSPDCEYSFVVDAAIEDNARARMEYGGRAHILDTELQKNNIPAGLLLRVSLPSYIRRLRRHDRRPADCAMMPGLMLVGRTPPVSRRKLLSGLAHYYRDNKRPKPGLINISAGGVCLRSEDPACQKFMPADENYLFFFFSDEGEGQKKLHVYVCKKVGGFRDQNMRHTGLRLKFVRQVIWKPLDDELIWRDVSETGSEDLRALLERSSRSGSASG